MINLISKIKIQISIIVGNIRSLFFPTTNYQHLTTNLGFSLIEMLVVIFVFSILGVVTTQVITQSLRGSKKSESISVAKIDVDYAVSNMERLLRNSTGLDCVNSCGADSCTSVGSNGNPAYLVYYDQYNTIYNISASSPKASPYFKCDLDSSKKLIASSSGVLVSGILESNPLPISSGSVEIISCSFQCLSGGGIPDGVIINITAKSKNAENTEGSIYPVHTRINLRNY